MTLIVYGANCVWWDSIDKASTNSVGLPCCPHCGSVLFQIEEQDWNSGAKEYQDAGHLGYMDFVTWLRGKCFHSRKDAEAAFEKSKS